MCIRFLLLLILTPTVAAQPFMSNGKTQNETGQSISALTEVIEAVGKSLAEAVGARHEGSVSKPRWNSLESPRHTVMTFRENMKYFRQGHEQAWPAIEKTLDFSAAEAHGQRRRDLAYTLDRIFNRFGEISPVRLDGPTEVEQNGISRFNVFPDALEHDALWRALDDAPDGEIILLRQGNGDWLFSAETVAGIEPLYDSIKAVPPRFERRDDLAVLGRIFNPTLQRTSAAQWLLLLATFVAAAVLAWAVYWLMRRLGRAAGKRNFEITGLVLQYLAAPLGFFVIIGGLIMGSSFVTFSSTLSALRWELITLLFIAALGYLAYKLVALLGVVLRSFVGNGHRDLADTAIPVLIRGVQIFLVVLLVLVALQNFFGLNVAGFLAGVGIAGLAIGLAAQEGLKNWFGTLSIFFTKPFVKGDWIIYEGKFGQVEDVGLNVTRIRLVHGEVLTIPNMKFIDTPVQNATLRQFLRREMDIALPYDSTPEQVDKALATVREVLNSEAVAGEDAGNFEKVGREPHVTFNEFESDHLNIRAYYWYYVPPKEAGYYEFLEHSDVVNRKLFAAFAENGLEFAFPTQTLHLASDDARGFTLNVANDDSAGAGEAEAAAGAKTGSESSKESSRKNGAD